MHGAGGAGLARFAVSGLLREGPCSTGREAGRPIGGMDPPKHSVGHLRGASRFSDRNGVPFGISAGGWEREMALASALCSHAELSSVFRGSTPLPPSVLSPSLPSESRAVDF